MFVVDYDCEDGVRRHEGVFDSRKDPSKTPLVPDLRTEEPTTVSRL